MHCIQEEYDYPVDMEFTINFSDNGDYLINLLQCRPLQILNDQAKIVMPEKIEKEFILLENIGVSMGLSRDVCLDIVVYVDPIAYYRMPYNEKNSVAKMIGRVNWYFREKKKHMMLIVPGRIGTSSPELGVPVSFSDISAFEVICELEETKAGYNPELSYGRHIFQALVEADILYTAVFGNEKTLYFSPEKLTFGRNITDSFDSEGHLDGIVKIFNMDNCSCNLYHDLREQHLLITVS